MIVVRLMGGHSNQLFQYAVGRHLAIKHKTNLLLDTRWFDEYADVDTPRDFEVGAYPLKAKTTKMKGIQVLDPSSPVPAGIKPFIKRLVSTKKVQLYREEGQGFNPKVLRLPDNTMLEGFFQCEKYFKPIRKQLLKELEPTEPLSKKNQGYVDAIKSCEAISVHVRREDYITNEAAAAFHGVMPVEYYEKAIKYIQKHAKKNSNLQLFVFSKEIDWCKKNLKFGLPMTFVEGNKLGSDDMRVMKHCEHFVMANSTFSWWGAWLSESKSKIVVAPKAWFKDKRANAEIDIVPEDWVRL